MTSTLLQTERSAECMATAAAALSSLWAGMRRTFAGWPMLGGRSLFYIILMTILSALWDRVAAEKVAGAIALPQGDMVLYVGVTEWITLAVPSFHLKLEDDIRRGALEAQLTHPKPYLLLAFAHSLGAGLVRLAVLGATALTLLLVSQREAPAPATFVLLLVMGVPGLVIGQLLYGLTGLLAFWTRRVLPFQLVVQKLMFLLGGLFAPLTLYPDAMLRFAEATPFAANLYWAASVVLHSTPVSILFGLGWQLLWIVVLSLLTALIWRAGLAKALREGLA
jgi:ABC-2 type transport system permease protein